MFLVYADTPQWAGFVEREIIERFNLVYLPKVSGPLGGRPYVAVGKARRSLVNIRGGGEGSCKEYVDHMFVYVLTDSATK